MGVMKILSLLLVQLFILLPFFNTAEAILISVKKANVRSGPGKANKPLFVYKTNAPFKILEEEGNWLKVEDFEAEIGWVNKSVVDPNKRGAIVKVANANIRRGPGLTHPVVFLAGYGVAFEVVGVENDWYEVKHEDGDIGWIQQDLVFSPHSEASSADNESLPQKTN
jgi:SH3-like domain-containing protein